MSSKNEKLSNRVLFGFGSGEIGGNLFFTVVAFLMMNYLTDVVGLPSVLAGIAIMLGKGWDAVADPVAGYLSDRTVSGMGRRRPWLLFASVPLGMTLFFMFKNPMLNNTLALFIWASLTFIVLSTLYTCVNIPYNAMTPDLTKDYDERTRLNGVKMFFGVCGTLLGGALAQPIINIFHDKTTGYMVMGGVFGLILTVSGIIPFLTIREPVLDAGKQRKENIIRSYFNALRNVPFLLILIPWTLNITGITVLTGTLVYYFKYLMHNENLLSSSMLILLVSAMTCIIIITLISKFVGRFGKKNIYITGMSVFTVAVLVIFFFGHRMGIPFLNIFMSVAGIGFSTQYVMPWSIVPDTIDYDYMKHGIKKEGVYYGLWTFLTKAGQAVAALFIGIILNVFGYIPNVEQSAKAIFGIRLLVGPITAFFFIAANIVLLFYPIDKKKYEEIQAEIKKMEGKAR